MKHKFAFAEYLTTFEPKTIGSKVLDRDCYLAAVSEALDRHDITKDRAPGQHFVVLPIDTFQFVSAGDGPKSLVPEHYVVRSHRGEPTMFLRRDQAGTVKFSAVVVYDRDAYNADPDVTREGRQVPEDITHVIVAVIASSGPEAPIGEHRLLCNVTGGNKVYAALWNPEGHDELAIASAGLAFVRDAKATLDYWSRWVVVAD